MPFCEECAKYWAPSAMREDGSCPSCGRMVEAPKVQAVASARQRITADSLDGKGLRELAGEDVKTPWHFKLLVVALVAYLGWRLVDLIGLA